MGFRGTLRRPRQRTIRLPTPTGPKTFVGADADHVDATVAKRLELLAEPLCGVDMEIGGVVSEDGRDLLDRLEDAGLVVDVHDRDQRSIPL